jgi:hypothetical protein
MNKYIKANHICSYRFCQLYGISEVAQLKEKTSIMNSAILV